MAAPQSTFAGSSKLKSRRSEPDWHLVEALVLSNGRRKTGPTDSAAPTTTTTIHARFFGTRSPEASTSSVRFNPSGVSSNAHAITSAIGNPIATATITNLTTQLGISRNGKTCVAICIDSQPTIAYATATL